MTEAPRDGTVDPEAPSRVPAVSRAVAVLSDIAVHGPASLANLGRRLRLPKSSLLGICQTLVEERLLVQDQQGRYALGLAVAELAAAQLRHPPKLARIGVAVPNTGNPFYVVELRALAEASAEIGAEIVALDSGQDVDVQIKQIGDLVNMRVDAIVLDAVHSTKVAGAVRLARSADIPVIAVNVGAEGADVTVTTDNVQAGQLVAHHLAGLLGGRGEVAIVDGEPVTATADRVAGFMSALREHPGVSVVARERGDHSPQAGRSIARGILAEHPRLAGFFGINDPTSTGIIEALEERGASVPVVSVDGSAAAVSAIAAGGPLKASAAQDPAQLARLALRLAAQVRAGERLVTQTRLLPTTLVTEANVADYHPWG
ncbi:substrate-binding domain-containing protein [Streptosporangium soli]|nr:substrate-binding domain-containing protein [Streptosporangium sp. KLBMP 9127]